MEGVTTLRATQLAFKNPEAIPLHEENHLRVEDIEDLDGTPGLYRAFSGRLYELSLAPKEHADIIEIMHFMHELHKDDRRRDGDGLGEGHLLRVAIDVIEVGVPDPNTIKAALLHDSVEDHAHKIILKLGKGRYTEKQLEGASEEWLQQESIRLMAEDEHIGADTASLIEQVTNEPRDQRRKKVDQYVAQMERLSEKDERAQLIKIMDQYDNAIRNHRTRDPILRHRLDLKYFRTIPIIKNIIRGDLSIIPTEARLRLLEAYEAGQQRATQRILSQTKLFLGSTSTKGMLAFDGNTVRLAS